MSAHRNNPSQWPSFENLSRTYAERAMHRINLVTVAVTVVQRWWRQRRRQLQRLQRSTEEDDGDPACADGKLKNVFPVIIGRLKVGSVKLGVRNFLSISDPFLTKQIFVYEKLDGTNVGIRCDGRKFGRRREIMGTSYQKIPLNDLPSATTIMSVKESISKIIGISKYRLPRFLIYGELMCNPGRFKYTERQLAQTKWFAFGAVFAAPDVEDTTTSDGTVDVDTDTKEGSIAPSEELFNALNANGFLATIAPESGKVTLRLNETLANLLTQCNINVVPFVSNGELLKVCLSLQNRLMETTNIEGMVLTGENVLYKWKTGIEDESTGNELLTMIQRTYSGSILKMAGVSEELISCLATVSGNRPDGLRTSSKQKQQRGNKQSKNNSNINNNNNNNKYSFSDDSLSKAYQSALTKYDALEEYFAKDERNDIIELLIAEVTTDVDAKTPEEMKFVHTHIKKKVGKAFGVWHGRNNNR